MSPSSAIRKLRALLSRRQKTRAMERHGTNSTRTTEDSWTQEKRSRATDVCHIDSAQPLETIEPEVRLIETCTDLSYRAIDDHSIRLIALKPGSGDDPIECTLSTLDLNTIGLKEAGPYETISYVWGDPQKRGEILCDGVRMSITRSLYDALKVLRYPTGSNPRMLWADGICINQKDDDEKTSQVSMMAKIYVCGAKVLIWLGHADVVRVTAALNLVCQLAGNDIKGGVSFQDSDSQDAAKSPLSNMTDNQPCYRLFNAECGQSMIITPDEVFDPRSKLPKGILKLLCPLFEAPWFQRVWVIQEYIMSMAAEVFWGNASFRFDLLGKAATRVLSDYHPLFAHYEASKGLDNCYDIYEMRQDLGKTNTFYETLMLSKDRQATDPRDKIFALVGLPYTDRCSEVFFPWAPDYNLSISDVYHITAKRLLVERDEVDLLSYVRHDPQVHETWASWVPDWTCSREGQARSDKKVSGYMPAVVSIPDCAICDTERHTISIRGIVVDTVHSLAADIFDKKPSIKGYGFNKLSRLRKGWLHAMSAFVNHYQSLFPDITLAKSLTAGQGLHLNPLQGPEDEKHFMAEYHSFVQYTQQRAESYLDYSESTNTFVNLVCNAVKRRRFFVTENGMLGHGPSTMEEGDVVAVLFGGSAPYVLRPVRDGRHWRLVGECYVHDVMDGQAVERWRDSDEPTTTDFHLF